jgi:predicted transcriptional regulator
MIAKKHSRRLGDLQLRILQELWNRGELSVAAVHEALVPERKLAYTTIATMMRKMEARGLMRHREEGRTFYYAPLVTADEVSRGMGDHLVQTLFKGSLASAVSFLLKSREVTRAELDEVERIVTEAKRKRK